MQPKVLELEGGYRYLRIPGADRQNRLKQRRRKSVQQYAVNLALLEDLLNLVRKLRAKAAQVAARAGAFPWGPIDPQGRLNGIHFREQDTGASRRLNAAGDAPRMRGHGGCTVAVGVNEENGGGG